MNHEGPNMTDDIPRRSRLEHMTPAERAIYDAVGVVEQAGCDVRLTEAVMWLQKARDRVADFVDGVNSSPSYRVSVTTQETLDGIVADREHYRLRWDEAQRAKAVAQKRIKSLEDGIVAENRRTSAIEQELQAVKDVLIARDEDFHPKYEATVAVMKILEERRAADRELEEIRYMLADTADDAEKELEGMRAPGETGAAVSALLSHDREWCAAAEKLDGRLGLPNDAEAVGAALEEYVAAEDALPDTFDGEDYRLSVSVASLVDNYKELKAVKDLLIARDEDYHPDNGLATVTEVVARILKERDQADERASTATDVLCGALGPNHGRGGLRRAVGRLVVGGYGGSRRDSIALTFADRADVRRDVVLLRDQLAAWLEDRRRTTIFLSGEWRDTSDGDPSGGADVLPDHDDSSGSGAAQADVAQRGQSNEGTHGPLDRPAPPEPARRSLRSVQGPRSYGEGETQGAYANESPCPACASQPVATYKTRSVHPGWAEPPKPYTKPKLTELVSREQLVAACKKAGTAYGNVYQTIFEALVKALEDS